MGPDPAWLGEAQGGLITAALVGLPIPAWTLRARWIGKLAGVTWAACVCLVCYYSLRGWTSPVEEFFGLRPPLWMPFWSGVAVGAILMWAVLRGARIMTEGIPPPGEPQSLPATQDYMLLWKALGRNERDVLEELWKRRDASISFAEAEGVLIGRLGEPLWNAVFRQLEEHGLMEKQIGAVRRPSRLGGKGAVFGDWTLTEKGRSLMAWRTHLVEQASEASTEHAPAASGSASQDPEPSTNEKRWLRLNPLERSMLERLWSAPGYSAPETILRGLVAVPSIESWRAATQTLEERGLTEPPAAYGLGPPSLTLAPNGRSLMAWRTRRAEAERVVGLLIGKAEWAVVNLQNNDMLTDREMLEGIDRWSAEVADLLAPLCAASDASHFRVLGSFTPDGLGGRTPEEARLRDLVSEKVKRLRVIVRKLETSVGLY